MRRFAGIALLAVAACGRIGFAELGSDGGDGGGDAPSAPRFTQIAAYGDSTCGAFDGRLYCWGENGIRQLGDGSQADRGAPTEVALPEGTLGAFTVGETHGCAIVTGKLFCWGEVTNTQVLPMPSVVSGTASDVAAGKRFTCAVVAQQAKCWGLNDTGQLGDAMMVDRDSIQPIAGMNSVVEIDAGDDHACARTTSGTALCWGHNDEGALGMGAFTPTQQLTPTIVTSGIASVPRIAGWHACALQNGSVFCWGRNNEGELGDGSIVARATPQMVPSFDNATVVATGGGPLDFDATCAIRMGELYCWGAGTAGRLGTGDTGNVVVPTKVSLPAQVTGVALGHAHTCALLADGDVWCWGRGSSGQLGDGTLATSFTPVRVTPPMTGG